uniref:Uncharacterized protein n=1 Tax=Megaselia scalaris TaxID=36166 RepID=T1GVX2_MEGSC
MALHRGGILYAVQDIPADPTAAPNNLQESYIELFGSKNFTSNAFKQERRRQPLMNYRNSLLHGDSEQQSAPAPVRKVYQNRRRRNDDDDSDDDDDDLNDPDFRG